MQEKDKCIDFYGGQLRVGDEVIPLLSEALILGISGIISKIEYNEKDNINYITISDKNGNVLLENVNARYYSTQERFEEQEYESVYSLRFYDDKFHIIYSLPLTNRTNPNYEMPEGTSVAILTAYHLVEKERKLSENSWSCPSYTLSNIHCFGVLGKTKLCYDKNDSFYYLLNPETRSWLPITVNHSFFESDEKLKKQIKDIIEYFNKENLTYINNDKEFSKNITGQKFEKKLLSKLHTIKRKGGLHI